MTMLWLIAFLMNAAFTLVNAWCYFKMGHHWWNLFAMGSCGFLAVYGLYQAVT
jgi:hypothetical protein